MLYVSGLDRATADAAFPLARGRAARRAEPPARRPATRPRWSRRTARDTSRIETGQRRPPRHRHLERSGVRAPRHRRGHRAPELRRHRARARTRCRRSIRKPIERQLPGAGHAWPLGEAVEPPPPPPVKLVAALRTFFANSTGAYGILIASPERVLVERYSAFGGTGSRDAKLVDDQGDHLHADRPADP